MSAESYVDSVRAQITERQRKVGEVVDVLRRLVREHALFNGAVDNPLWLESVEWDESNSGTQAQLMLLDEDGRMIPQEYVDPDNKTDAVHSARFDLFDPNDLDTGYLTAMTIETQPPNVRGYDGVPLSTRQLDGAIADLQRYEEGLIVDSTGEV